MVTHGVSVVGVAGWPVILTGWLVTVGVVSQPASDVSGTGVCVLGVVTKTRFALFCYEMLALANLDF